VFVEPSGGWADMTQTAELTASDGASKDALGTSVSISGGTVVSGAPYATIGGNLDQGAAYVFVEPSGGWSNMTQTAKLTASDGGPSDGLGTSAAACSQTIVIGAPNTANNQAQKGGAAYVFVEPPTGWMNKTQNARLTAPIGDFPELLGSSVAIDGDRIVVGAPSYSPGLYFGGEGAAFVFEKPLAGWANGIASGKGIGSDAKGGSFLGTSVAVSGHVVVAGAMFNSNLRRTSGGAYIFVGP
jgi:hypothetical protein